MVRERKKRALRISVDYFLVCDRLSPGHVTCAVVAGSARAEMGAGVGTLGRAPPPTPPPPPPTALPAEV